MNREVEERIVRMYFDNQDFEKNAKTTIETLGELKNGLNMEESAKGMQVFEKIGNTLNFDKSTKGLSKLKTGFKSMEGALGKMFKIGEEPIREAENVVGQIRSIFTRVIGYDIASKLVGSIENAVRSLTIAPISAGWSQYEQKMDSVKTIMSSTGESIDVVQEHLADLTEYANKTIYSLSDMTSNLGKFTNNGMKLEDSVKAMEGIANAAADAGQGAQQASMAMYNFSQAMGVGKMTTIDWKSIENANMATQRLKNTFIEMAAANGDLQKEFDETDKKYHYYITKNSKGQTIKDKKQWTEVTAKNFRETLSKDWLTAQSMMRGLMVYSGDSIDPDTLKSWGITDPEQIKNLEKIGKDALEAATQVRTFTKMMDALKESVQSGWADSFELIFGNMTQGTNFWTYLNDELGEILDKSSKIRNNILKIWSGDHTDTSKQEEELSEKNELLKQAQERLQNLIESEDLEQNEAKIKRYLEWIQRDSEELAKLKADNKGGKNNVKIKNLQATINDYKQKSKELEKLNADLAKKLEKRAKTQTEIDAVQSQVDLYKSEIQGLKNTLSYTTDADQYNKQIKNITEKERALAKLQEKLDKLKKEQDKDELLKTQKEVEALMKEVEELNNEIDEANKKPKSSIVDDQGRTGREILIDSIKEIIALAKELGSTFSKAFHNVFGTMDAQKLFNLTQNFEKAILAIKEWLHEGTEGATRIDKIRKILEGVFSIFKIGFNVLKAGFNLIKRIAKPVLEFLIDRFAKVGEFFTSLINLSPAEAFQKIGDKLKETWEKVKKFFTPQDIYNEQGNKIGAEIPAITWIKNAWNGLKTIIRQWANDTGISGVYDTIAGWWDNIKKGFEEGLAIVKNWWNTNSTVQSVKKFLQGIYDEVAGWFMPKTGYRYVGSMKEEYTEDMPIVAFFKNFYKGIEDAFRQVENWWNTDPNVEKVKSILSEIVSMVAGWFVDEEGKFLAENSPIVKFFVNVGDKIKAAWETLKTVVPWEEIGQFLSNTWDWIMKIIGFDGGESEDESEVKGANTLARRLTAAAGMSSITYAVNEVTKETSGITEGDAETVEKKVSLFERIIGVFTDFFNAIGEAASGLVQSPELREFFGALGEFFRGLVSVLTKVLEFLGRFMNGNATVEDSILLVLGVVLTALIEGISMWRTANLSDIAGSTQSIGLQFLEIAAGLMLVASAVSLLTAIDESKMATASVYIALLGGIIATIISAIGGVASAASATTRTPVERVLTNLINRIAMVGALYIIIKELPTIIQAIGEAKKQGAENVGEDILKIAEGIAILFGAVSLSFSLMNTFMPQGMNPISAIKTALSISGVVAVMVTIFNVIGTIPRLVGKITGAGEEESVADTVANLNAFGEIMGALGAALGNFFGSIIGAFSGGISKGEILSQFSSIKDGAAIAGTISEEDLTAFTRLMSIMQNLNKSIPDYTLLQKWVNGNKLSDFAKQLPDLGAGLRGMADYLSGIGDEDMEKIREGAKFISYFANAMSIMASILGGEIGRVNAMVPNNFVLQQYIDAAEQLSEAVKKGLMDGQGNITGLEFNAMPIVEAICKALEQGEYAIAKAVKNMVNAGLQDIDDGDYSSYNALKVPEEVVTYYEQLSGKLRTNSGEVVDLNALIKDAIGDESEYAQLMAQIDTKTNELSSKISGMSNVFDDLNLTKVKTIDLDTGEEVETSWLEILQNQMAELSTTLDETPLEVKITPVFDFSNLEPEKLQSEFSRQLFSRPLLAKTIFQNPTESIDFVQIAADLGINDIKDKLDLILAAIGVADTNNTSAITGLGTNIDGVSDAIAGMELVLDTGVLVGQISPRIDAALGHSSDAYYRTGVEYKLPK